METNITWHTASVLKEERRKKSGHHSFVLWFTGLSASGKSTVANAVARKLFEKILVIMYSMAIIFVMV